MGDRAKMQQLPEATKKRIEWLNLMKNFIPPLYHEIEKQTEERRQLYLQILDYLPMARGRGKSDEYYSKALKTAENYIKANRKWIALTEINKQCQKIETDVSFHTEQKTSSEAVARVIYASKYCEDELSKGKLKEKLPEVRNKLAEYCDGQFELAAKNGTKPMTYKIKEKLKNRKVTPEKIVKKVAEVNDIKLPS